MRKRRRHILLTAAALIVIVMGCCACAGSFGGEADDVEASAPAQEKWSEDDVFQGDDISQEAVDDEEDLVKKYGGWAFFGDYFDFCGNILEEKPYIDDYDTVEGYYYDLYAWYEEAKEAYLAIDSCPACMAGDWKKYGDTLELNQSICQKLYLAMLYGDNLRYLSAMNMSERFDVVEEIRFNAFMDCLEGEMQHTGRQRRLTLDIAEEIHAYAKLEAEERREYEFENAVSGKIFLDYDVVDTIYPSLYNSYDAFLIIKTGCVSGNRKILVEAEIPGFTQDYKETFTLDSAYKAIYIKPPALAGDLNLSSSKEAQIKVTVSEQDGTLLEAKSFPVTIKSKYDFEWYSEEYGVSTQDNILCFMAPESESVSELKRQAIEEISGMTGGQMESFVGYQNTRWNDHYVGTYLQAAGIMRALYEMGVRYNMDPFSLSGSNQHILLPDDVLQQKSGLCVETSLTVASALQSAGMHAFLVFPPNHAQVAVEIWNGSGNDISGTGEYFLIETTALSDRTNYRDIFIDNANGILDGIAPVSGPIEYYNQDEWYEYLMQEGTYIIDCDDMNVLGLTPFSN